MPEDPNSEEKKKYQVIDRRRSSDDESPAAEAPKPEQPEPVPQAAPPPPEAEEEPAAHERRAPGIADSFALILNLLREHALNCLGMLIPAPGAPKPDAAKAGEAAAMFQSLASKFPDLSKQLTQGLPKEELDMKPDLNSVLILALNIMQSQIVINMGLIADPGTGLVVKNIPDARKGIDIFAELIEIAKPLLPPQAARQLDAALSDLRLNFVNISGTP